MKNILQYVLLSNTYTESFYRNLTEKDFWDALDKLYIYLAIDKIKEFILYIIRGLGFSDESEFIASSILVLFFVMMFIGYVSRPNESDNNRKDNNKS